MENQTSSLSAGRRIMSKSIGTKRSKAEPREAEEGLTQRHKGTEEERQNHGWQNNTKSYDFAIHHFAKSSFLLSVPLCLCVRFACLWFRIPLTRRSSTKTSPSKATPAPPSS